MIFISKPIRVTDRLFERIKEISDSEGVSYAIAAEKLFLNEDNNPTKIEKMQKEIDTLKQRLDYINKTVNALIKGQQNKQDINLVNEILNQIKDTNKSFEMGNLNYDRKQRNLNLQPMNKNIGGNSLAEKTIKEVLKQND